MAETAFLTLGWCKTLLGLEPVLRTIPRLAQIKGTLDTARAAYKPCCGGTPPVTVQLNKEVAQAILEASDEGKQAVLNAVGVKLLQGYVQKDGKVVILPIAGSP